jgi:hypothetical protein
MRLLASSVLALAAAVQLGCVTRTVYVVDDDPTPAPAPQSAPRVVEAPPSSGPAVAYEDQAGIYGVDDFYEPLSPYGRWISYPGYGMVWQPSVAVVGAGFRPYTHGHWERTEYGWTWVDHHPFGWATGHYGRWFYDGVYGWVWVPGTVWAPAWVSWRYGGGYVGWAPMPPGAVFGGAYTVYETSWVFVSYSSFGVGYIGSAIIVGPAYRTCYYATYPARDTVVVYGRTYYSGPDEREVERGGGHVIHRPVREVDSERPVTRPPEGAVRPRDDDGRTSGRARDRDDGAAGRPRDRDDGRGDVRDPRDDDRGHNGRGDDGRGNGRDDVRDPRDDGRGVDIRNPREDRYDDRVDGRDDARDPRGARPDIRVPDRGNAPDVVRPEDAGQGVITTRPEEPRDPRDNDVRADRGRDIVLPGAADPRPDVVVPDDRGQGVDTRPTDPRIDTRPVRPVEPRPIDPRVPYHDDDLPKKQYPENPDRFRSFNRPDVNQLPSRTPSPVSPNVGPSRGVDRGPVVRDRGYEPPRTNVAPSRPQAPVVTQPQQQEQPQGDGNANNGKKKSSTTTKKPVTSKKR